MTYLNSCPSCKIRFEWRAPRFTSPDPECPKCAGSTERVPTAPAIVWSKPLSAYGDKTKETFAKDEKAGGHWVFERDSDRAKEAGKPIPRFISSAADQSDYCRKEGLINPKDLPTNMNVSKDGMSYETSNLGEV